MPPVAASDPTAAPAPHPGGGRALLDAQKALANNALRLTVALGLGNGALLIAQAWLLASVIDALVFGDADRARVQPWLLGLLLIVALRALLVWAGEQSAWRAAFTVKQRMRDALYRHLQAAGPQWLTTERSGALAEDVTKGIEALEAYYARYLPAMTLTALVPLAILLAVAPLDWLSGLIMALTAPLIPLFMILIGKRVESVNRRQWKTLARMGAHFLDSIQGLTTLKLFNASQREAALIARISDDYCRHTMEVLRVAFLSSAVLEFFATIGIAIVAVFIGFRLYAIGLPLPVGLTPPDISFFTGFFVLLLAPEFYLPLRNLGTHYHGRMEALAAAERIGQVLATPVAPRARDPRPLASVGPVDIVFDDVHFAYAEGRPALTGASFRLEPGARVALVGPSGAGKSTVASVLLGFIAPSTGQVHIDGEPLDRLDIDAWRRQLAWLPQRPRLFQGTLLDNIRLGMPDAGLDAVRAAARRAHAEEFIARLPDGYLTVVGERGAGLSGGQIQRIALARAFLREARFVLLDEATASLDAASEALVQQGIEALAVGRTLLVIAHRLATVERADRILVLNAGRIVEQGTHRQLLDRDGLYRRLLLAGTDTAA